jgi:hypothetical protein
MRTSRGRDDRCTAREVVRFPAVREPAHRSRWLARILYSERFPEDLARIVKEFYTLFCHQASTDQQISALLAGADPRRR